MPELAAAVRQVEEELGDEEGCWFAIRDEYMCRVMVEGPTAAITEKYCSQLADLVKRSLG